MARAARERALLLSQATHVQLDYDRVLEGEPRRPYVVLELLGPNGRPALLQGLLDTGADYSTLPMGIAARLGFDEDDLQPLAGGATAAGGRPILLRKAPQPVKARLERSPLEFELEPRFIPTAEGARPADLLWGRQDFLWHWDLELSERDKRLALEWRR